ncbi:glycosyltransferase family 2 protein [Halomonas mongoliensis]|uniref:glycosyltransferase family 2 protein n=1 Tax=Halomonas mongoliensis TaxID=321265 RepID=UPI00403AA1F2
MTSETTDSLTITAGSEMGSVGAGFKDSGKNMVNLDNVSVVIPSYKSEKFIGRAISSCLSEGVVDRNIIVVEDGVFDKTSDEVRKFFGVVLYSFPSNQGAQYARNFGLSHVTTEYVIFLDADDYFEGGSVLGLLNAIDNNKSDISIGPWRYKWSERNGSIRYAREKNNFEWIGHWLNEGFHPPCSVMWRSRSVRTIGAWDESIKKNQDGELMVRGFLNDLRVAVSHSGCSVYWQHQSPNRVSLGSLEYSIEAAEKIYNQLLGNGDVVRSVSDYALGRFCCKMAWHSCLIPSKRRATLWRDRAIKHGYLKKGYNKKSNFLAAFFGVRLSANIKSILLPRLIDLIRK